MPAVRINTDPKLHVSVEEAVVLLCEKLPFPKGKQQVELQQAMHRILAEDFVTPFPMPPFRRSAMDGYAVSSEWTAAASPVNKAVFPVAGETRAGGHRQDAEGKSMPVQSVMRIFTGAPVPDGFDAVVVQEMAKPFVKRDGQKWMEIDRPALAGTHIAEAGEDVPAQTVLLKKGKPVGLRETAILASYGHSAAFVYPKPVVAVLPIGDELLTAGQPLLPHHIYDANGITVNAFARMAGADTMLHAPIADRLEAIEAALHAAQEQAELIVTTGGISVGDYDYAGRAAIRCGWEPLFTKVLMRPGTPTSSYRKGEKLLICLSGNPSACYSALELLVKPVLMKLSGQSGYKSVWLEGILEAPITKPCPYPRFIRATTCYAGGQWRVAPLTNDRSGNIAAFAEATALAVIPAGGRGAGAGEAVRFIQLT
ncbi:molybdopterin molybdotransferase MoeA [Paenibacillus gorillae]|uniref:molybdopterin molybdotransferase MoeA n=1 Tax=Paenibacillus gorillae TaxID=1243662 RepID=UPI0004B39671|nr:molybdopterin molybdotransferase MoeA [Paenibacillus gorillae]